MPLRRLPSSVSARALVSTLEKKGRPSIVQRTLIRPPSSRLGPLKKKERKDVIADSPVLGLYDEAKDRESAYEILTKRTEQKAKAEEEQRELEKREKEARRNRVTIPKPPAKRRRTSRRQSTTEAFAKSIARSVGTQIGRALIRGILGSIKKGF